ncbi:MFS general substrate transporter [Neoconidiobolus thromboides FSU 785]|nr:MFS general substrate transporter [Neoconidiobolus thromboides FSU 785]
MSRSSSSNEETQRLLEEYSKGLQKDIHKRRFGSTDSIESNNDQPKDKSKSKYGKGLVLLCVLLLAFGSHYSGHALGSLKADLKKNMQITNHEYGVLQSSVALVNTILPVIGGLSIDKFGTSKGSILATSFITLGTIMVAISTNISYFPMMIIGRLVYGLGSGTIVIIQGAIITHWFKDSHLSSIMGMKMISSRVASFLAMASVIPIAQKTGFYGNGFWLAAILCILSLLFNIFFVILSNKQKEELSNEELEDLKKKKKFEYKDIFQLPKLFWLFGLISFTLAACSNTFLHFNTELLMLRFELPDSKAGYIASLSQLFPLILPPLTGAFIDRFGGRLTIAISSGMTYCISIYLLGFTFVNPIIGMLLFSYSLSVGPVSFLSGVSVLISDLGIGTALGLYKSSMNIAASFQDILVGNLQLTDQKQNHVILNELISNYSQNGNIHAYDKVMLFMLITGIIGLVFTLVLFIFDKIQYHSKLNVNSKKLKEIEQLYVENRSYSSLNKVSIIIYSISLVSCWLLFGYSLF